MTTDKIREAFDKWYDAFAFRKAHDKYGPTEAAFEVWTAALSSNVEMRAQAGQTDEIIQALKASVAVGSDKEWVSIRRHVRDAAVAALAASPAQGAAAPAMEAGRPDILEKLTYHGLERDDMTLEDCLSFLRTNGWHEVHGRTAREMVLQLTELLAAAPSPQVQQAQPCEWCCGTGRFADHDCRHCAGKGSGSVFRQQPHPQGAERVGDTRFEGWLNEHEISDVKGSKLPVYHKQDMRDSYWAGYMERAALGEQEHKPQASGGKEGRDEQR